MENYVAQQLGALGVSALLGALAGLLYDLLRAFRLRRRSSHTLTHVIDGIYVVAVLLALFRLALGVGEGELRLYMMAGTVLGAVAYFQLPARLLRPLWDFWADVMAAFGALLLRPLLYALRLLKKLWRLLKKCFDFLRNCGTIIWSRQNSIRIRKKSADRGGCEDYVNQEEKDKTE